MPDSSLRIGTRGSALALWQANRLKTLLTRKHGVTCELVRIRTTGDQKPDVPLSVIGGKGAFIKEIESALLAGDVDLAVHSAKDIPSEVAAGTLLASYPECEDPRDALVVRADVSGKTLEALPEGALVGTGSLRRACQLRALRPDLKISGIRGNVDTRLRKLREGEFDAIVLALAGLRRLNLAAEVSQVLEPDLVLPAVAQGILAVQAREDSGAGALVGAIDDPEIRLRATVERAFLTCFAASCQVPVAGHATLTREGSGAKRVDFVARIISLDGKNIFQGTDSIQISEDADTRSILGDAADLGRRVGQLVLDQGGQQVLDEIYRQEPS